MMTGTRDTGNINDDRDTGTQLQRGHRGKQGDKPDNLFICKDNGTAKNVVYSQVLRS